MDKNGHKMTEIGQSRPKMKSRTVKKYFIKTHQIRIDLRCSRQIRYTKNNNQGHSN